ncbi:ABC-type transport auxiliary lipoprotein family protein [Mesorhizobium sp. LHD-90]|uniref:ABC-type transport auxiliary lipoprotein family protein n=1 Tax=Mesorhizobium sp. LHD-90 TaxID=3071414 RepID=UPI0027DFEF2E|nr:ABC-type transport auxiliary lipoprotein family protein [Mesorhizobium sp. LHD-90]MDQ6437942.1 ABC-type transport auxiliary lipoprotein family protein [Mesorhizobium sp. LHD-90]
MKLLSLSSALLSVAVSLSGCALLGAGAPPLDTYDLSAPDAPEARGRSNTQILIAEPGALKALDGQNIVIRTGPGAIQFLKGAQWADRLPLVVQAKLAQSFQAAGGFSGVGTPGEGLAIDYQVVCEIRAFEVRVGAGNQAHVEIYARVLNDRNGTVRAAKVFRASSPVSGSGNDAFVRGLDAAFGTVGAEIVDWVDAQI